jgi:hypothetical protein
MKTFLQGVLGGLTFGGYHLYVLDKQYQADRAIHAYEMKEIEYAKNKAIADIKKARWW